MTIKNPVFFALFLLFAACGGNAAIRPHSMTFTAMAKGQDKPLKNGSVLRTGDHFMFDILLDQEAYVYVVYLGADGEAQVLEPADGAAPKKWPAGVSIRFPSVRGAWFKMIDTDASERQQIENMFIVSTTRPLSEDEPELEGLIAAVGTSGRVPAAYDSPQVSETQVETEAASERAPQAAETLPERSLPVAEGPDANPANPKPETGKTVEGQGAQEKGPASTEAKKVAKKRRSKRRKKRKAPKPNGWNSRGVTVTVPGGEATIVRKSDRWGVIAIRFALRHLP